MKKDIENKIWDYGKLSPDEQREIEAYVLKHPELQILLDKVKMRMEYVASFSDPEREFERLTGYSLEEEFNENPQKERRLTYAENRKPVGHSQTPFAYRKRWTIAGVLVSLVALWMVVWPNNRNQRLAYSVRSAIVQESEIDALRVIDVPVELLPLDMLLVRGKVTLLEAQRNLLGTAYWYNSRLLDEAEGVFKRALNKDRPPTHFTSEALFFLGKISLARDETVRAKDYFEDVVQRQNGWVSEAGVMIGKIQAEEAR